MSRVILNIIHSLINSFTFHSCRETETGISEETGRHTGPGHCPFDPPGSSDHTEDQAWPPAAAENNSSLISGRRINLKFPRKKSRENKTLTAGDSIQHVRNPD